jgi:hypothetical protein
MRRLRRFGTFLKELSLVLRPLSFVDFDSLLLPFSFDPRIHFAWANHPNAAQFLNHFRN